MGNKLTLDVVKERILDIAPGYDILDDTYISAKSELLFRCPSNHIFFKKWCQFQWGYHCKTCSNNAKQEQMSHGLEYVRNFIKNKAKGYELLSKQYINNKSTIIVKCNQGHEWSTCFNTFVVGGRCNKCGKIATGVQRQLGIEEIKRRINTIAPGFKLLSTEYKSVGTIIDILCPNNHILNIRWHDFKRSKNCKYCDKTYESKGEKICREVFEKIFNKQFVKIKPDWMRNPKTNYPLELDGYNEELKLAFEYDGAQHYISKQRFGGEKGLKYRQYKDKLKNKLCKEKGVTLIRIPYTENKILEEFIKSELTKNNVNIGEQQ